MTIVARRLTLKKMAAGVFKTNCLAVMDEVQAKREAVVITKHGKPVAKLVPVEAEHDDIFDFLRRESVRRDHFATGLLSE
jgi:antitoxin (DNA-binding transcriptional repressor) of toxin-antitoxin stability system